MPAYNGVSHTIEIPFVSNNPDFIGPWLGYQELRNLMTDMWIHFAHDGTPNGVNQVADRTRRINLTGDQYTNGVHIGMPETVDNLTSRSQTSDSVNVTGLSRPYWPAYDEDPSGLNLVLQTQGQGGIYVQTDTYPLKGREYLSQWAKRRRV